MQNGVYEDMLMMFAVPIIVGLDTFYLTDKHHHVLAYLFFIPYFHFMHFIFNFYFFLNFQRKNKRKRQCGQWGQVGIGSDKAK